MPSTGNSNWLHLAAELPKNYLPSPKTAAAGGEKGTTAVAAAAVVER